MLLSRQVAKIGWLLLPGAVIWLLIAALTATGFYLTFGAESNSSLPVYLGRQARVWMAWLLFSPLLIYLITRWQHKGRSYPRQVLGHILLLTLLFGIIYLYFGYVLLQYEETDLTLGRAVRQWAQTLAGIREQAVFREMIFYFFIHFVIYLLISTLAYGLFWYRDRQQTRLEHVQVQAQLAEARLSNLQAQLQPHFLFNALNSVAGLVRGHENDRAVEAIGDLGQLLRLSFQRRETALVRLEEELELVEAYLRLEKLRFSDKLSVQYDLEPGVEKLLVPVFVLQPLVENAVKHGLSMVNRPGILTVSARQENHRLHLEVTDDGAGPGRRGISNGTGLRNLEHRLRLLYGETATLDLMPRPGGGTIVHVTLPAHED